MPKYYEVKGRRSGTGIWVLYTTTKDLAMTDSMIEEAFEMGDYDAIKVVEVKKKGIKLVWFDGRTTVPKQ